MDFAEILVVDDEKSIRNALCRELKHKVAVIHTAESALEALNVLEQHSVDLIITDYRMPAMTGTDLLKEVKHKYPYIPAIMLSGQADFRGVTEAINSGVLHHYVDKPWDPEQLEAVICKTLLQHETEQDHRTSMKPERELNRCLAMLPELSPKGRPWLLMILDIANTAAFNRQHGKASGNTLIQYVAKQLCGNDGIDWYRSDDKFMTLVEYSAQGYLFVNRILEQVDHISQHHIHEFSVHCYMSEARYWPCYSFEQFSSMKSNVHAISKQLFWLLHNDNQDIAEEYCELGTLIGDLDNGRVEAFFQPQMTLTNGEINCCEALVRRRLDDNSYQSPCEFLHVISKYELDDLLATTMVKHAVNMLQRVSQQGRLKISINVSAKQLITGFVYQLLCDMEAERGISMSDIEVEVVETDQIYNYPQALQQIEKLHAKGITLAIDDFGTGYSGFEYLCELPFDVVKIDGRFVKALGNNVSDEVILASITNSAQSLNMEVVAEWVETRKQVDYLKRRGCTRIQGYIVSPPLPMDEFLYFLDNRVAGVDL
ncbi:EAL domain-containing response regulator [Vibrio ostreicida]|uniref:EAL domain-containing response regulator n=1 Tax=Vibrio ostreicida TaxID=526588 RepID=UPI0009710B0F|nr:EAL domain-containing protein [Vibrio ostreicida]